MEKVILTDQFGRTIPFYILDKDMYEITDAPEKEEPETEENSTESNLDLPYSGDNK